MNKVYNQCQRKGHHHRVTIIAPIPVSRNFIWNIFPLTVKFLPPVTRFLFQPTWHSVKSISCETQLAFFVNDIILRVDAAFLDFAKAFDKVPHDQLYLKISSINSDPLVCTWLKNFSTGHKHFVPIKFPCPKPHSFPVYPKVLHLVQCCS